MEEGKATANGSTGHIFKKIAVEDGNELHPFDLMFVAEKSGAGPDAVVMQNGAGYGGQNGSKIDHESGMVFLLK